MNWNKHTVLVTGADGFIGSHLTERLVELGAKTRALVQYNSTNSWGWLDSSPLRMKKNVQVFLGDIRDRDSLKPALKGVDVVFHLAALIAIPYSYKAPLSYMETNAIGTLNVLEAARNCGVQLLVHTSTSEVYGTAQSVPIREDHSVQAQSPYSASKIAADKIAESFYFSYKFPVAIIRPFNTFGPRQSQRAVIPTIITQALTQNEICLGALKPTRDFNYVADTVEAFIRMARSPEAIGTVVNIGSGREISIGDLTKAILKLTGNRLPIRCHKERIRPADSEVQCLLADNTKARRLLGWKGRYTLEDGLASTINWIKANIDQYRANRYVL